MASLESENAILLSQVSDLNNDISLLESELEALQTEVIDVFAVSMNVSIFCNGASPSALPAFIRNQVANNIRDRFILDFFQDHDVYFPWPSEDFDLDSYIQSIEDYTQNLVVPLYASHGYLLSRDTCIDVTYESVGELLD